MDRPVPVQPGRKRCPARRKRYAVPSQTVTIAEAAELTGLSKIALRRRVQRGSLRSVLRDGVHRIPLSELYREGLAVPGGDVLQETADESSGTHLVRPNRRVQPVVHPSWEAMLDRLLAQEREIGELRALSAQAESLRAAAEAERRAREVIETELHEARARIAELETAHVVPPESPPAAPSRRWWTPWRRPQEPSPASP
jgi:hypothetical protein